MKHKKILLALWAFAVLTRLSAQNKELLGYLPGDAKVVVHVNLGKLSQKLSWQEITQMDFFQELMHKAGATAENFITHPAETGLDFSAGLYLAATINTPSEEDENAGKGNYVVILGKMGDEKTFASLVKKNAGKKTTITTAGANNFILDKEASLAWNKSVCLLHIQTGNKKQKSGNAKATLSKKELSALQGQLAALVTPGKESFYTSDPRFLELVSQNPDIAVWSDGGLGKLANLKKNPFAGLNINLFAKDNYKASAINFENGRIISRNMNWLNDSVISSMKAIYNRPYNAGLLNKIPEGQPLFFFTFSMNPEEMGAYFEKTGLTKIYQGMLEKDSIRLSDFKGALQGDFMIAVNMAEKKNETAEEKPNPLSGLQVYLAATVKDQQKMDKLLATVKEKTAEAKRKKEEVLRDNRDIADSTEMAVAVPDLERDSTAITEAISPSEEAEDSTGQAYPVKKSPFGDLKPVISNENGLFLLSLSQDALDAYKENNSNRFFKPINDQYGKEPMLMMMDLKTILSAVISFAPKKNNASEEEMQQVMDVIGTFGKMTVYGGKVEDHTITTTTEFSFSNPDENSLKQLIKLLDLVSGFAAQKK